MRFFGKEINPQKNSAFKKMEPELIFKKIRTKLRINYEIAFKISIISKKMYTTLIDLIWLSSPDVNKRFIL